MKLTRKDVIRLLEQAGEREVPKPSAKFVRSLDKTLRSKPFANRPVARGPIQVPRDEVPLARGPRVPAWPAVAAGLLLVAAVVVFSTRSNKSIVNFITGERAAPTTSTTREPLPPTTIAASPGAVLTVPTTVLVPTTTSSTTIPTPTTVGAAAPRVTTTTTAVPAPTMRLTVTPGSAGHFSLNWEKYAGPVFDQYVILRTFSPDKPTYPANSNTTVLGTVRTQTQTAWDDQPPTTKGNVYYMVVAVSSGGNELGRTTTAQGEIKPA